MGGWVCMYVYECVCARALATVCVSFSKPSGAPVYQKLLLNDPTHSLYVWGLLRWAMKAVTFSAFH